jgi:hypothetical protein
MWHRFGRVKLAPLLIACLISILLPLSIFPRTVIGFVVYGLLYIIRWKRADGSPALPRFIW